MSEPFAMLPDEITLSRAEVATILSALDLAEATARPPAREDMRRAIRVLTSKLWPELGDLLGDEDA